MLHYCLLATSDVPKSLFALMVHLLTTYNFNRGLNHVNCVHIDIDSQLVLLKTVAQ